KGVLVEETPELDTVEARQKVRTVIGVVAGLVILLAVVLLVRQFRGEPEPPADDGVLAGPPYQGSAPPPKPDTAKQEEQARLMLRTARRGGKAGRSTVASPRLDRLMETYPNTECAKEAKAAKERHVQGLPLFPDGPTVIAQKADAAAPKKSADSGSEPGPG